MLKFRTFAHIGTLLPLIVNPPNIVYGEENNSPEQDVEAMEAIIADFCRTKNLCHGKQTGNFIVYLYDESKTTESLSDADKNSIAACTKKYEIRMTQQNINTLYVYCYDEKKPIMLLEKITTQNYDLR